MSSTPDLPNDTSAGLAQRLPHFPGLGILRVLRDLARGGDARTSRLLRMRRPADLFQPFGTTGEDRYPEIFARLRDEIGDGADRRLLSFGCSTGEEVFTLRRYFPKASLTGIDISARRIAIARRRVPASDRDRTRFIVAGSAQGEPAEHYDAVLTMAVFRHGDLADGPDRIGAGLSFDRFEAAVAELASRVRSGGWLAIRHANFRFADTAASIDFTAAMAAEVITPHYGRDGVRLPYVMLEPCLFHRRPHAGASAAGA